jgi:TolB-like protein/Tfp pilus assembly protein PilF
VASFGRLPATVRTLSDLREQLQESLGSAYTIERELGDGGMSRVFVADEAALGRRVVVKLLPTELMGGVSIARFHREISLAARLQHPHLVPLLAAGEVDGQPYYTMPFVEGESLRARLSHGELPIAETISILRDVARALEYAHGKGVTHRDIKPDNVLLAGRSAVVTDLGVAKAISDAAATSGTMTSAGVALGTPTYMSPEQAAADPTTDHRADIYAFGMMAYEMLAGHAPFAGRSTQAVFAAHAVEVPADIALMRPATPTRLAELVMRCIAKKPGDRPQTAADVANELETIATPGDGSGSRRVSAATPTSVGSRRAIFIAAGLLVVGAIGLSAFWGARGGVSADAIRSIAVLPFENKSGDTTFDYLQDGVTDQVRDALNAIPELTVKARSSSQQMKGRDAREIGSKLGVGAVLQGTVSGSSTRLHVTAELVRTSDDAALWSATFEGRPSELLGMQDTIRRAVSGKLRLVSTAQASPRLAAHGARGTDDPEAYDLMLRGRHALDRTDFTRAEAFFRQALARDPNFARARAFLAVAQAALPLMGVGPLDSIDVEVRRNAAAALAADSTIIESYIAESNAIGNDLHFAESIAPLERAIRIDSNHVDLLTAYGLTLAMVGRIPAAVAVLRRVHERDPLSVSGMGIYGYTLALSGRLDEGISQVRAALALDPNEVILNRGFGYLLGFAGQPDSALAHFERAYRIDSTNFGGRANLIFGYALTGRWGDARRDRAVLQRSRGGHSANFDLMTSDIAFGEYDKAMSDLERAVDAREPMLWINSLPCDPTFDPLKSNPRFSRVMARLGATPCPPRYRWPIRRPPE